MKGFRTLLLIAFIGGSLLIATILTIINIEVTQRRADTLHRQQNVGAAAQQQQQQPTATETFPPNTPLPSVTPIPTVTLRPPPTLEPPTITPQPTIAPTETARPTLRVEVDNPGFNGLETPSLTPDVPCERRTDWTLTYTVQPLDALARIAEQYGTTAEQLAAGNCLPDANVIVVNQVLRVPGDAPPDPNRVECVPWEVLTPINYAFEVDGTGLINFTWRGPQASRNLLRIFDDDGEIVYEKTVDLRQNVTVNAGVDLPEAAGNYTWRIYPLNLSFIQVDCVESPAWTFHKTEGVVGF